MGLVAGAAIAATATIGGALISNSGTRTAANATTAAADRSAAVVERNYDRSAAALQPWQTSGLRANSQINALLGLGGTPDIPATPATPGYGGGLGGFGSGFGGAAGGWNPSMGGLPPGSPAYGWFGNGSGSSTAPGGGPTGGYGIPATPGTPAIPGQTSQQAASAAFDQYRNSTGYQFRLGEGNRGVNSAYAGAGTIKSGDAMRGIAEFNQNFASNEFGNYMGALGGQQAQGLTAAQAQAGVGGSAANSLAGIYQNQGDNIANAALLRAQNTGSALNTLGTIGGGLLGRSSYGNANALAPSVAATHAANPGIF